MLLPKSIGFLLLVLLGVGLCPQNVSGVVIYRIGTPFSTAEKDSLAGLGIDFREIDWTVSQLQDGLDLDSLPAGSLQPNYFDEDEDIAATLLSRGGWVRVRLFANQNKLIGEVSGRWRSDYGPHVASRSSRELSGGHLADPQ